MGDWVYYVTAMSFADVVRHVKFAEEVCPNTDLDMMIQREVTERSMEIAAYLRAQEQRFFGALIIAAYDGQPKFLPISFTDAPVLSQIEDKIGILQFDGSEQYYAVDGQHRLAAMKSVVDQDPDRYRTDEVSVIVICHSKDAQGMSRARRLFTTVNRYAKKTSPVTNIVMDEDDGLAIITRRLIREEEFFTKRTKVVNPTRSGAPSLATSEAMKPADRHFLMAIGTFYKCNSHLLPNPLRPSFANKQHTPEYDRLEQGYTAIKDRWMRLIAGIDSWSSLRPASANLDHLRTEDGGHVLARPVGIASFTRAAGAAFDAGIAESVIFGCVKQYSDLREAPWKGLLWNVSSKKMLAGKEREETASKVWKYLLGIPGDNAALNREWRSFVDPSNEQANLSLPPPIAP
jgi:DNA sulfur modification protein DndB